MTGILLIDKPRAISSAGTLNQIKRKLGRIKIGHTGTLDPQATGLMVCLTGGATTLAQFFAENTKVYSGEIVLGVETSTDDLEGEVLAQKEVSSSEEEIRNASKQFIGQITQVPPRVSAVKVDGERAYKLARQGEDFELKSRTVNVSSFQISGIKEGRISFEISCSSGTYIRSIARDLGKLLGCGGALGPLRRIGVGPFNVSQALIPDAVTMDQIRPWWELFPTAPVCEVGSQLESGARRGLKLPVERELRHKVGHLDADLALLRNKDTGSFFGLASRDDDESWRLRQCL